MLRKLHFPLSELRVSGGPVVSVIRGSVGERKSRRVRRVVCGELVDDPGAVYERYKGGEKQQAGPLPWSRVLA